MANPTDLLDARSAANLSMDPNYLLLFAVIFIAVVLAGIVIAKFVGKGVDQWKGALWWGVWGIAAGLVPALLFWGYESGSPEAYLTAWPIAIGLLSTVVYLGIGKMRTQLTEVA